MSETPLCTVCGVNVAQRTRGGHARPTCCYCRLNPEKSKFIPFDAALIPSDHKPPACKTCGEHPAKRQSTARGLRSDYTPYYNGECARCILRKQKERHPRREDAVRPLCAVCSIRLADKKSWGGGYRPTCSTCRRSEEATAALYDEQKSRRDEINKTPHIRPLCDVCGVNLAKKHTKKGRNADGSPAYYAKCATCMGSEPGWRSSMRRHRKIGLDAFGDLPTCLCCGFVPKHRCQIDIDHIDGNNKNNSVENLQPLCANCHRLKTRLAEDDRQWLETARAGWRHVGVEPS